MHFFTKIPPFGVNNNQIGDFDYSNEMKALGVSLDLKKDRAKDIITAYRHSLSSSPDVFDPTVSHHFVFSPFKNDLFSIIFPVDCT